MIQEEIIKIINIINIINLKHKSQNLPKIYS